MLQLLDPAPGLSVLDLTVGAGGHSVEIMKRLVGQGLLVGVDRDPDILPVAARTLGEGGVRLIRGSFGDLPRLREQLPLAVFDRVLADLGVSSLQLNEAARGFSFRREGPLDMRMDPTSGVSAREVVNAASAEELARILVEFGEERYAKQVARAIVRARGGRSLETTTQLAEIVRAAIPARAGESIDPATRTFQALRIAVNHELAALDHLLQRFDAMLAPGGRIAIISYHSLEDRRVKQAFRQRVREGDYVLLTRRAVRPTAGEVARNQRSRSARLRVLEKRARKGFQ